MLVVTTFVSSYAQKRSSSCYHGYIETGYTSGVGNYEFGRFEINTSHGYQITPILYIVGGGVLHFMSDIWNRYRR